MSALFGSRITTRYSQFFTMRDSLDIASSVIGCVVLSAPLRVAETRLSELEAAGVGRQFIEKRRYDVP